MFYRKSATCFGGYCIILKENLLSLAQNIQGFIMLLHYFKKINPPDATISLVYYLTFTCMYGSTCLERPHAHHQKLNNCSSSLWFYCWSVVVAVLLVVVGPAGRPDHNQ